MRHFDFKMFQLRTFCQCSQCSFGADNYQIVKNVSIRKITTKSICQQESIPARCVPPACQLHVLRRPPDVSVWMGLQVYEFEQVGEEEGRSHV